MLNHTFNFCGILPRHRSIAMGFSKWLPWRNTSLAISTVFSFLLLHMFMGYLEIRKVFLETPRCEVGLDSIQALWSHGDSIDLFM